MFNGCIGFVDGVVAHDRPGPLGVVVGEREPTGSEFEVAAHDKRVFDDELVAVAPIAFDALEERAGAL